MYEIIVTVLLVMSMLANVLLTMLLVRASKRLIQFDDLFVMLVHEMGTNIKFLDGFADRPVLSNSPEIKEATRGIKIMRNRLKEYVLRVGEIRNEEEGEENG